MATDSLAEIFEDKPQAPVETPAPAPEPVAAPAAPIAATPAPEPPKPAEPSKPEPGFVPIAGMLDEREKRQAAERRVAELEERFKQTPSVPNDPNELAAYVNEQTQRALVSERFDISQIVATEKHGEAAVKEAMEWGMQRAQASPAFAAEYVRQKNPIDWAVRQHKKEKLVSELGDDEATQKAYIERRARELGLIPQTPSPQSASAPAAPQPTPLPTRSQPLPTRSLAAATSAGGPQVPVLKTDQELFKEAFS